MANDVKKVVDKKVDNKPKSTNGMAIAGFVCSFVCQILGLIFSIIGLTQIKKSGEDGRGLAIAGIIISGIIMFIAIIAIIIAIVFGTFVADKAIRDFPNRNCHYNSVYYGNGKYDLQYKCD